jgi:hypothetical protein
MTSGLLEAVRARVVAGDLGEDARYTDAYDALKELHDGSFDDDTGAFVKDWRGIVTAGVALTRDIGVHLRVLDMTGQAIVYLHGYPGLAEVAAAWALVFSDAWDDVHPTRAKARRGATQSFVTKLEGWIGKREQLPESTDGAVDADKAIEAFADVLVERIDDVRPLTDTRTVLSWFAQEAEAAADKARADAAAAEEKRKAEEAERQAREAAAQERAAQAAAAPAPPVVATQPTPAPAPVQAAPRVEVPTATVASAPTGADASALTKWVTANRGPFLTVAGQWQELDPSRPEPYRLARDLRWGPLSAPASTTLVVQQLPAPHRLERLAKAKDWAGLLAAAEGSWPRFVYWLTAHRFVARALQGLGHDVAADAVRDCARGLLARMPDLSDVRYVCNLPGPRPDGTIGKQDPVPVVDHATRVWLEERPAGGDEAEEEEVGLDERLRRATSPQARARLLCDHARAMVDAGDADKALPVLQGLRDRLHHGALAEWDSALAQDVFLALWLASSSTSAESEVLAEITREAARLGHLVPAP